MSGISSQKIHVSLSGNKGLISLNPMKAQLYKGSYAGNVQLDARSKTLKISVDENLKGVQVEPLLTAMNGSSKISGAANAHVKLSGVGNNTDLIKQSLTGNGNFSFTDGALKGINIAHTIRKAKAALVGKTIPDDAKVKTDFSSLSGSFTANKGLIKNQDLKMVAPLLRVTGAGSANLGNEVIDYGLVVAIVNSIKGAGAQDLEDLKGLSIPLKITGTFSNPKPRIDLANLVQQKVKEEAKAKLKEALKEKIGTDKLNIKLKEKLGDNLGDQLGDKLGGLLGAGKSATTEEPKSAPKAAPDAEQTAPAKEKPADALKNKLRSLF